MRLIPLMGMTTLLLVASLPAWGSVMPGERQERRPPQEAYTACLGKHEGDAVTVTTPRGETLTAFCRKLDGQLVAMPEKMPPPPDGEADQRVPGGN
jgi:hypothetical protein